jgi:HKD family nuclease
MQFDNLELTQGFATAFIDKNNTSNLAFKPQFISNNYKEGRKVLSSIEEELLKCDQFYISVAFITMSGLTPLLQTLKHLEARRIKGQLLTTDYLNFSDPKALDKLNELTNINLKMYKTEGSEEGFHTKGYIFKKEEIYRIIVGSSNVTLGALTKNKEWNSKIISTENGEYADEIIKEYKALWNSELAISYEDIKDEYITRFELIKKQ